MTHFSATYTPGDILAHRLRNRLAEWLFKSEHLINAAHSKLRPFARECPAPDLSEVNAFASRCRAILRENLADFFFQIIDLDNGGYLEDADDKGFFNRGQKSLLMQARQMWFFSLLAKENIDIKRSLMAARHGYEFIRSNFKDSVYGGYVKIVRDDGEIVDGSKMVRHQSFVLYGLSAFAVVAGEKQIEEDAEELVQILHANAYDSTLACYIECQRRDWTPIGAHEYNVHETLPGASSLNAEMHVMEAMTEMFSLSPTSFVESRLEELLLRCVTRFKHPHLPANINYRLIESNTPYFSRRNLLATYGHDLELVWLVFETLRSLGYSLHSVRTWAEQICQYSIVHGYDSKFGGFFNLGSFKGLHWGVPEREKVWWVQAEAMITMLEMYRLTGDAAYFEVFRKTFKFVEKNFLSPDGGWWRSVSRRGEPPTSRVRASQHQGGYHSGRAMARCASLLDKIAAEIDKTYAEGGMSGRIPD